MEEVEQTGLNDGFTWTEENRIASEIFAEFAPSIGKHKFI